mmetsp:Transcript_14074/g.15740  ORF Transcript_14074/g.15740 Transcript_14074/m.15740 type:complete len:250 (-) Transcript_14074:300-1049(-)
MGLEEKEAVRAKAEKKESHSPKEKDRKKKKKKVKKQQEEEEEENDTESETEVNEGSKLSEEEMIRESERTKSGEEILKDIEVGLYETEIEDVQYIFDNSNGVELEMAQEKMVKLQQLLKETELSDDDGSMDGMPCTPSDTGINNSDSEPVAMNEGNDDDDDKESYHTNDGMGQEEDTHPIDDMETSEDEESSEGDWGDESSDDSLESSYKEDDNKSGDTGGSEHNQQGTPMIVEKEGESKEEGAGEWTV